MDQLMCASLPTPTVGMKLACEKYWRWRRCTYNDGLLADVAGSGWPYATILVSSSKS